jgi:gas vesicle structural protein
MTLTTTTGYPGQIAYVPARAGTLYDVLELILDRGMVIDVFVRVSLVGIEILKIDARVVVASVDTYLRFAEACNRLDLERDEASRTVPELFGGGGTGRALGKRGAKSAIGSIGEKVREAVGGSDDEDADDADHGDDESDGSGASGRPRPAPRKKSTATARTRARKKANA